MAENKSTRKNKKLYVRGQKMNKEVACRLH